MSNPLPTTPEALIPRLGDQLVEMGLLSEAQLKHALEYQRQQAEQGQPCLLGQALITQGVLDRATLDRAITEQIVYLRTALIDANHNLEERVRQRTAELEEALRKLAELNQLKANFVANISHELRTPLTHIRGYLELLHTAALGDLNEDQRNSVEVSLRSAARLQHLIDDLILFSLASQDELTLHLKSVDLNLLIAPIFTRNNPKAVEKSIELTLALEPSLPLVQADDEKISWVISQLLDNAIKFTPEGGKVTLEIVRQENVVILNVRDTGIGIPPERETEVFEPFHQLDGSATRRYGGTGLGLTLARQIVEAHGSHLNLRSTPGEGTTFYFPLLFAQPYSKKAAE
ncbi:MAG: ATP-binding protein [Anaerolineales bacterium]|jgi:signal transduction histidine kinase|nr:ATP-binding protein [Anaerolineales bacterium]